MGATPYLNMLSACPTDAKFIEVVGQICQPVNVGGRQVRAFNPSAQKDLNLLRFLTQGQWAVEGFRNRDLVAWLEPNASQLDPAERRKWTARASRVLAILKAHGLIQKVSKTHRYQVSLKGHNVASLVIATANVQAKELMEKAA